MVWISAAVGVGSALLGSNASGQASKRARREVETGIKRVEDNTNFKGYSRGGANAFNQSQNLLGVGDGSPEAQAAARGGFQNYLNSAGYKTQLDSGIDALNSNAAARGMLKSGATLKATQRFGAGLGQQYFNNYIGQLNQQAGYGMQADQNLSNVYTGGAATKANSQQANGAQQAQAWAGAGANIAGALGDKAGAATTAAKTGGG